jgi:hypothetical protein
MNEIDLPININCKNCHGHGYIWLSGYSDNEKHLICTVNDLALLVNNKNKAHCLLCDGKGSINLDKLELAQ